MKWLKKITGVQELINEQKTTNTLLKKVGLLGIIIEQEETNKLLREVIELKKYHINESSKIIIKRQGIKT